MISVNGGVKIGTPIEDVKLTSFPSRNCFLKLKSEIYWFNFLASL